MRVRAEMGDHARVYSPNRGRPHRPWPIPVSAIQVLAGAVAHVSWHGFLLLLAGPTILLMARRRPAWAVAGVCAVALGFLALGNPLPPVIPSIAAAVILAVTSGARVAAWLSLLGLWLGWLGLGLVHVRAFDGVLAEARGLGLAVLLAAMAEFVDNRKQRAAAYRKLWDEERRRREEERRRREEEAQRRAGEQRLQIARELHDVLAHSLSLITVRASVALELIDTNPGEVKEALMAIKQASKSGLAEVRSVLHGFRGEDAPLAPAPDLSGLDELVEQAGAAGLAVQLTRTGVSGDVPAAAGLAGYRIIQEALTNVIRHSSARSAVVSVHHTGWALLIGVADAGPARSPDGESGSGLIGIRERATALGGWAEAGPTPDGGFEVRVALPK